MSGPVCSDIDVPAVEWDFCKKSLAQLIDAKLRKNELEAKDIDIWSLKMKSHHENIKKYLDTMKNHHIRKREELKMLLLELQTNLPQSSTILNLTQKQEEELSIMEKIQQKARQSWRCWQISVLGNEGKCVVTTFYEAVKCIVTFDTTNGKVENIVPILAGFKANAQLIIIYIMNQFRIKLSSKLLASSLGQHYDILSFLDYVTLTYLHFEKVFEEYCELVNEYKFEMHPDRRVSFVLTSMEMKLALVVEVNFADDILSEDSVKVHVILGSVDETAVKKCINGCPQGFEAFLPFAHNVKNYINSLKLSLRN